VYAKEEYVTTHVTAFSDSKTFYNRTNNDEPIAGPGSYDYCDNMIGKRLLVSSFSNMPQYTFCKQKIPGKEPLTRNNVSNLNRVHI
jgi:hypothetical protein